MRQQLSYLTCPLSWQPRQHVLELARGSRPDKPKSGGQRRGERVAKVMREKRRQQNRMSPFNDPIADQ